MAAAALETKQVEQIKAMLQDMPEVMGIVNAFKQMFAQFGHGGVHEVSDKQTASIGDEAIRGTEQTAAQAKAAAMVAQANSNLPPRPTLPA